MLFRFVSVAILFLSISFSFFILILKYYMFYIRHMNIRMRMCVRLCLRTGGISLQNRGHKNLVYRVVICFFSFSVCKVAKSCRPRVFHARQAYSIMACWQVWHPGQLSSCHDSRVSKCFECVTLVYAAKASLDQLYGEYGLWSWIWRSLSRTSSWFGWHTETWTFVSYMLLFGLRVSRVSMFIAFSPRLASEALGTYFVSRRYTNRVQMDPPLFVGRRSKRLRITVRFHGENPIP